MDIDEALAAVKPLGRTQMLTVLLAILANFQIGFLILSVTFNAEIPPHHCTLRYGRTLNESIPMTNDHHYSSCTEFVNRTASRDTQTCSQGWEYDTELTGTSITSEWNLVCSQDILRDLSQTFLFCGFSIGSLLGGPIGDKYGRKRPTMCSLVLLNMAGIASAFSPNYATFVGLRFLMGLTWKVAQIPLFTLLFENLLPRHRPTVGSVPVPFFSFSLVIMAGIAYLVRDWREFSIIMMTPSLLMMLFSWLLPESIRWAATHGKLEKTKSVLLKIAKFNKVDPPDWSLLDKPLTIALEIPIYNVPPNHKCSTPIDTLTQDVSSNQASDLAVCTSSEDVTRKKKSNIPVETSVQDVYRNQTFKISVNNSTQDVDCYQKSNILVTNSTQDVSTCNQRTNSAVDTSTQGVTRNQESNIPVETSTLDITRSQTSDFPVDTSTQDVIPNQTLQIPVNKSTQDVPRNHTSNITVDTSTLDVTGYQNYKISHEGSQQEHKKNAKIQSITLLQLFKKPTRTVTVILCWLWISYSMGYFGFALTTGTLAGDPYINFILSGLVELPARIFPLFVVKKTGNLLLLLCSFATASFVMIGVIILRYLINQFDDHDLEWLLTTLALLGKFFSTFVFVPLFLCTTELFPTTVRNTGTGFVQLVGNIGSLSSPLLIYLDKSVFNLPFIIMASFALVASFLCLFLPETLNVTQPETPADLQKLFETNLFLKNVKKTFQCEGGVRQSDDKEMTEKYSKGNDNPGFEAE